MRWIKNWVEACTPNHVFKSNHGLGIRAGFLLAGKIPTISPIEFCTAFAFELSSVEHVGTLPQVARRSCTIMTRGNQREQDRLKAQKKAVAGQKKPKESAATLAKRKEADAEILRAKQKKKEEEKAVAEGSKK